MAKIKFGAAVVDARGKLGGHVFSKNRGGSYMRTKVTPVNPQTSDQLEIRGYFTTLTQNWKALSEQERTSFNNAVSNFSISDVFGDVKLLTGHQLHQKLNMNLLIIGEGQITEAPQPQGAATVFPVSLTAGTSPQSLSLTTSGDVPSGVKMIVYATPQVSAGKKFVKNQYRIIQVINEGTTSPFNLLSAYQAKFGNIIAAGSKIGVKIVFVNKTTGESALGGSIMAIVS